MRRLTGIFESEASVLAAAREARSAGLEIEDVYSPYPIHGIDEAMGLRRSRIPFACLAGAVFGGGFALWFQNWSSSVSWAVDVGGKPFSSIPAFIPIAFELTVLGGALGAVAALLVRRRLRPGRRARVVDPRVTDDRFALVLLPDGSRLSAERIAERLSAWGAEEVRREDPESEAPRPAVSRRRVNSALAVGIAILVTLHLTLRPDPTERGVDVTPDMVVSVPYNSFAANPVLPGGMTLQSPPEGAIPRGLPPEHFEKTEEDALRAGERLANPFSADDDAALRRGKEIFRTYCVACHGAGGTGDGPVAKRGFPPPKSLVGDSARQMKDGRLYHVITVGQANMPGYGPLIARKDRWRAVLYVRSLQAPEAK